MAQIRDTNVIRTPEVTVDPRLFLPDGIIDMTTKSPEIDPDAPTAFPASTGEDLEIVDGEVIYDEGTDTSTGEGGFENDTLPTPQYILVLNQVIRIAPDGKALVDVTIDVEDIPGITNYEVRVAKL